MLFILLLGGIIMKEKKKYTLKAKKSVYSSNKRPHYLVVSTSFMRGFARVLDLSGSKAWPSLPESDGLEKDYLALREDWISVRDAFGEEFKKYVHSRKGII